MADRERDQATNVNPRGANPGYAALQIAKALTTSEEHDDPAARERAGERIARWQTVLGNILTGSVQYGSRAPVEGVPAWATLEVITGGFATGALLAGGPIQEYERLLLADLPAVPAGEERRALNAHFLTDAGLRWLVDRLRTGCYDVAVPEEGALLVVAWLVEHGYAEEARMLLEALAPFFSRLRFYPIPAEQPLRTGSRVHLQTVERTLEDLHRIGPNRRILAQKAAAEVWLPLYDRVVGLFLETVVHGWPCQRYRDGWSNRADALLGEYLGLRREHGSSGRFERGGEHHAQLLGYLTKCAADPASLTGREVGRVRLILERYIEKRGAPDSPTCAEARARQAADVSAPTFHAIAGVVADRMKTAPKADGLDDVGYLAETVTGEEAASTGVPEGTSVPESIRRKVERCLNETVDALVERGIITSGETLARVLPQMSSGLGAAGIVDPTLRQLYAAIYRAFRRRRSLLLLNLEKQVQIEELPWAAAIDRFRSENLSSRELARQTLEEVTVLTLRSFPYAILPNKLLQELRALVKGAELDIPLVDEVAADIFMGVFSGKFLESAKRAGQLLDGALYATYYGIDYSAVRRIPEPKEPPKPAWSWLRKGGSAEPFAELCAARAGVSLGTWDPATNGMIVEQQQILTTQNLAALFAGLGLQEVLGRELGAMARECFAWVCRRQQVKADRRHARLIMLKNTAYAWRQMVFFLTLLPAREVSDFLGWAEDHLAKQEEGFRDRFRPAFVGLSLAAAGRTLDGDEARQAGSRRLLGWSKERHWLTQSSP